MRRLVTILMALVLAGTVFGQHHLFLKRSSGAAAPYQESPINDAKTYVAFIGDDLIVPLSIQARAMDSLGSSYATYSRGVAGNTTWQMRSRLQTNILDSLNGLSHQPTLVVLGGIADILADTTAARIEANLQAIYTAAHNASLKVIAVSIPPFKTATGWTSGRQAKLDSVNDWIVCSATNVEYRADAYFLLEDPANADTYLSAYDGGDHKYPSTVGYNVIGDIVYWKAAGVGIPVWQNWYIQGSPSTATLESFGLHRGGIVYQSTIGVPPNETNVRSAANTAAGEGNYDGILMWDYEERWLIDPRNTGDGWSLDSVRSYYKKQSNIQRWAKNQQPTLKHGQFAWPPSGMVDGTSASFWTGNRDTAGHTGAWQQANDSMKYLEDSVDFMCFGEYPFTADTSYFFTWMRTLANETKRVRPAGKLLYAFTSPQGMPPDWPVGGTFGQPMTEEYYYALLQTFYDIGVDGIGMWASTLENGDHYYYWADFAGPWKAIQKFTARHRTR